LISPTIYNGIVVHVAKLLIDQSAKPLSYNEISTLAWANPLTYYYEIVADLAKLLMHLLLFIGINNVIAITVATSDSVQSQVTEGLVQYTFRVCITGHT
jgi:hypothetical protein